MKKGPTDYLAIQNLRSKVYTPEENRLLDQITLEITEAWAKDLKKIKQTHEKLLQTQETTKEITNLLNERLPSLECFLSDDSIKFLFKSYTETIEKIGLEISECHKNIFDFTDKYKIDNYKDISGAHKKIDEITETLKDILIKLNEINKPWYKKNFKKVSI